MILIRRLAFVAFFFEVGFLLVVLPWSEFWEHNYFAAAWPPVHSIRDEQLRARRRQRPWRREPGGRVCRPGRGARHARALERVAQRSLGVLTFLFCLVTDRHRLCSEAVAPVTFEAARRRLVDQAKWAVTSNIDLIQVRERDLEAHGPGDARRRPRAAEPRIRNARGRQRSRRCRAGLRRRRRASPSRLDPGGRGARDHAGRVSRRSIGA